jgi:predicted metalloenzyme YecM
MKELLTMALPEARGNVYTRWKQLIKNKTLQLGIFIPEVKPQGDGTQLMKMTLRVSARGLSLLVPFWQQE